jgi:hypothetical protein
MGYERTISGRIRYDGIATSTMNYEEWGFRGADRTTLGVIIIRWQLQK